MKFKLGEVVKIIGQGGKKRGKIIHAYDVGDTVRITEYDSSDGSFRCSPVFCKKSCHDVFFGQWVSLEDLEPSKTALDYILEDL